MTRLAIFNPTSLTGKEVKEALESRRELWTELRLLTLDSEEYGLLSEIGGEATIVQQLSADSIAGVDLVFVCPDPAEKLDEVLARMASIPRMIVVDPTLVPRGMPTVVAGASLAAVDSGHQPIRLVSPHPGAIAVTHLLKPLVDLGLTEAVACLMLPASLLGQAGIDELLAQTRGVLTFDSEFPREVFGGQMALNAVPAGGSEEVVAALRDALGTDLRLAIQLVQGAVFHSISASVFVRCAPETTCEQIESALEASPYIELVSGAEGPGPIDASGRAVLLAGSVRPQTGTPGGFWLWGVMDNLTLGGAGNALAIAEALLGTAH